MKLVKWFTNEKPENFEKLDIKLIGYSIDRSIQIGLYFGSGTPTGIFNTTIDEVKPKSFTVSKQLLSDNKVKFLTKDILTDLIKTFRTNELKVLTVGITKENTEIELDADETSQERISRAITGLDDNETIAWKATNNEWYSLDKVSLKQALKNAGAKQSALWIKYNF